MMSEDELIRPPSLDWFWQEGRMGFGEFYQPSDNLDAAKSQARCLYMIAMREYIPGLLEELELIVPRYRSIPAKEGQPRCTKGALDAVCLSFGEYSMLPQIEQSEPKLADFVKCFLEWATKFNIKEWWIWDQAIETLEQANAWDLPFGYHFGTTGLAQGCPYESELHRFTLRGAKVERTVEPADDYGRRFLFDPGGWDPMYQLKRTFRERMMEKFEFALDQYIREFEEFMFESEFARTKELREVDHFIMAALRRVSGLKWSEIAERFCLSPDSVKDAVRKVEELMDVPPSQGARGRPRRTKTGE